MPIGAAVSAAGAIGKGILGATAAGKASNAAQKAAAQTVDFTKSVYGNTQANVDPYISSGGNATTELMGLLGTGGNPAAAAKAWDTYRNSTNYQFMLNQGLQGIEYANAPAFSSSATAKALNNYAQGMAGNALQGYEGLLVGQQGLGLQAGLGLGGIGMAGAGIINNALQQKASTMGQADVYGATSWGNAINGITGLFNQQQTGSSFGAGAGSSASSANTVGGQYAQFADLLG